MTAATFAAAAVTLTAAHQLADHVLGQTDRQAVNKAKPGWAGWQHIAGHVFLYHAVMLFMLGAARLALDLPISGFGTAAGIGFSMASHAIIDRRWPVRWILRRTGSAPFAETAHGMYVSDQALHHFCLWVSALLLVGI
jgi:hypothetical protein